MSESTSVPSASTSTPPTPTSTSVGAKVLSFASNPLGALRVAASTLQQRLQFAIRTGLGWGSKRDELIQVLGYERILTVPIYRSRYERDGLAHRLNELPAIETWGGGFKIYDNDDVEVSTPFQDAWKSLDQRLKVTLKFKRADIIAGLGPYSIILIGASRGGKKIDLSTPMDKNLNGPDSVIYLTPVAQDHALVVEWVLDASDKRCGLPLYYSVTLGAPGGAGIWVDDTHGYTRPGTRREKVHWSRIIHIAEGCTDNETFGTPRLRHVFDLLDGLWKVIHGGGEAAWRRMDPGISFELDPLIDFAPHPETGKSAEEQVWDQAEDYYTGLQRFMVTTGVKTTPLNAVVDKYAANVDSFLKLLSASTGYPLRMLTGAEAGHLASDQDRANAQERKTERREGFAEPNVIRQFIDRCVEYGALPTPIDDKYEISWGDAALELSEGEKATVISSLALANKNQQSTGDTIILTTSEIRSEYLGLEPLSKDQLPEPPPPPTIVNPNDPNVTDDGNDPNVNPATGKRTQPNDGGAGTPKPNSANISIDLLTSASPHKYGSTQVNLPPEISSTIITLGQTIDSDDLELSEGGLETNPHVTIKYGLLDSVTVDDVISVLSNVSPVRLALGITASFNATDTHDYDVLIVKVVSADLRALNELLSAMLPTIDTQTSYVPHVTVAYLKTGTASKYVGVGALNGVRVVVDEVVLTMVDGSTHTIKLTGTSTGTGVN